MLNRGSALLREGLQVDGTRQVRISVLSLAIGIASFLAIASPSAYAQAYSYTGSEQIYIVPAATTLVDIVASGAPGGKGSFAQGSTGALVSAELPVPQGQNVLYVEVGGTGDGFNGGGLSNGGDASDVRLVSREVPGSIGSRIIVAGGGGGAGQYPGGNAGADGGGGPAGGKAGTLTAGGAGGLGQPPQECSDGSPGSLGFGGDGVANFFGSSPFGGGGGGYYGGGGGGSIGGCAYPSFYPTGFGGGGGGSSYVIPQASGVTVGLDLTRTPEVTITPVTAVAPPPAAIALSALRVKPSLVALRGRLVRGLCVPLTAGNRAERPCRRPFKLQISYTLSAATTVTFTIARTLAGRQVGGQCAAPTRRNRNAPTCKRTITLPGGFTQAGGAGPNSLIFRGRIRGRALTPGSYHLLALAAGAPGRSQQRAGFRVVP